MSKRIIEGKADKIIYSTEREPTTQHKKREKETRKK